MATTRKRTTAKPRATGNQGTNPQATLVNAVSSPFADYQAKAWPHVFHGTLHVEIIAGGIPTNPNVAEGWIRSKLEAKDDTIRGMVAATMKARGVDAEGKLTREDQEEVIEQVAALKSLNGFKRDKDGLYIEGRQLKAALKEAVSVAVASDKITQRGWGSTKKWITTYFPEHVFVVEDKLHLLIDNQPITDHTGINQRFVTTRMGDRAIQYEEFVEGCDIDFTITSDHDFTDEEWAMIWLTGERQGIGAARSAGFGVYKVTHWEKQ